MSAATVVLKPVADTTLIEAAPNNNLGAQEFFNAGSANITPGRNRGLLRFDLSLIPANARILEASLLLEVVLEPPSAPFSNFRLHRVLRSWGEGDKKPAFSPGLGVPAMAGEATWNHRHYPNESWMAPGGAFGSDFAQEFSSEQFIYGVGDSPYLFGSTVRMVEDVRFWVENPNGNFGWALVTTSENVGRTARRFGSRETAGSEPQLLITYEEGRAPARMENSRVEGGLFKFDFAAELGTTYTVLSSPRLNPPNWTTNAVFAAPQQTNRISYQTGTSAKAEFFRLLAAP